MGFFFKRDKQHSQPPATAIDMREQVICDLTEKGIFQSCAKIIEAFLQIMGNRDLVDSAIGGIYIIAPQEQGPIKVKLKAYLGLMMEDIIEGKDILIQSGNMTLKSRLCEDFGVSPLLFENDYSLNCIGEEQFVWTVFVYAFKGIYGEYKLPYYERLKILEDMIRKEFPDLKAFCVTPVDC